ncbi:MAG: HNH endonuclease [Planctomycetes bacterium]|nr:HNH endonuclease [Planctomycetota bacterium]
MTAHSPYLASLGEEDRKALEIRLLDRQTGHCFICDETIDLVLHGGQLDIDHIIPRADNGPDEENNFALTHATCNRQKGASDLRVARRIAEFEKLQRTAIGEGKRGANLGDVLGRYNGAKANLKLKRYPDAVEFTLTAVDKNDIRRVPLYKDQLSGMEYFFAVLPLEYLHHDDRINPRSIGANIRGLIEEFLQKRPQLHVALAWWSPESDGSGHIKIFDGQHKAAAQIMLGMKELPVRVFVEPDTNVLLVANTNAGSALRQVAFDVAVMRHLGSSLFMERVRQYKDMKGLPENNYSFSEKDLVAFFRGEHREMLRYIIDAVRDSITHNKDNGLMEFIEWAGKTADRPLAYSTIERTFFSEFIYMKALDAPLDNGMERGENARLLERDQIVRLMSLFAEIFFVGKWDPEIGGRKLENRLQKGDQIPENHLRAWRIAREEILANVLTWVRLVIENYNAYTGRMIDKERLLQYALPEDLWQRIRTFLNNLGALPCWIDKNLSNTVFGAKQNRDFWTDVFKTGKTQTGVRVLAEPLNLQTMIVNRST